MVSLARPHLGLRRRLSLNGSQQLLAALVFTALIVTLFPSVSRFFISAREFPVHDVTSDIDHPMLRGWRKPMKSSSCNAWGSQMKTMKFSEAPSGRLPRKAPREQAVQYTEMFQTIKKGSGHIERNAAIIAFLDHIQGTSLGLVGDVGEIGVHHGRFFIALAHLARKGEQILAADLFEGRGEKNIDLSGAGDIDAFKTNLETFGLQPEEDVKVLKANSFDLPLEMGMRYRMFSVDGGHFGPIVFNDMLFATCNLHHGGVVIADDIFNPGWLGVLEGVISFLQVPELPLYPFLLCDNKLYLTNSEEHRKLYMSRFASSSFWADKLIDKTVSKDGVILHDLPLALNNVEYRRCNTSTDLESYRSEWERIVSTE